MDQPPVGRSEDKRHEHNFSTEGFALHVRRAAAMMHGVWSQSGAHSWKTRPEPPPFPPPALALLVWCTGRPHPWCSAEKQLQKQFSEPSGGAVSVAQLYILLKVILLPLYKLRGKVGGKSEKQHKHSRSI